MPWLNQLVDHAFAGARAEQQIAIARYDAAGQIESFWRFARMSAQISPIGVRDMVLPPMPTESPSCTNEAASSSETTFSRRLRSRCARSLAQFAVGCVTHAHVDVPSPTSALNSSIRRSQAGMVSTSDCQKS